MKSTHFLRRHATTGLELFFILVLLGRIYGDIHDGQPIYDFLTWIVLPLYAAFYIMAASAHVILAIATSMSDETATRIVVERAKNGKTEPIAGRHSLAFNLLTYLDTIVLVAACWVAGLSHIAIAIGASFLVGKPLEYINMLRFRRAEDKVSAIRKGLSTEEEPAPAAEPRITRIGNCIAVHGPFSVDILSDLENMAPDGAVIDIHAARLLDATMVIGPAAELDALARNPDILEAARARSRAELSAVRLPDGALEWHATGYRGASSNAIFHYLLGLPCRDGYHTPSDASDFSRCRLLLERVPEFALKFGRMTDASPDWARLVSRWPEICARMDEECPDWRLGGASCPATTALIRNIVD